jgi:4-hydroxy-tetrahydrodipicolinate synthase
MKAFLHNEIFGNWATLLLTTDSTGAIDYSKLTDEIDTLIASKPNGIYSNGTAGEFYAQTEKEFEQISMLLATKCDHSNTPFQIGISHTSPQTSLQRLQLIKHLKPCAVQLILPDWFPPIMDEAIYFLQRIQEEAEGISLILYNPPHAKKQLVPEDWAILKENVPSLQGLKVFDHDADSAWYSKARANSQGLSIFIPGHRLATGIKSGAHGSYSNMACLNPFAAQQWYSLIMENMEAGLELENRIAMFMREYIRPLILVHQYSNQSCDRFLALLGGWADVGEKMRWPYRSIPAEYVNKIKTAAIDLIPEFFR